MPRGESGGPPILVRVRAEVMGGPGNIVEELRLRGGLIMPLLGGLMRFSFWRLRGEVVKKVLLVVGE